MRDSDPKVTALARPRTIWKRKLQTRLLAREGAPNQEALIFRQKSKPGQGLQMGAKHQNRKKCFPSVLHWRLSWVLIYIYKAIPVKGRGGLEGCETIRIPHCLNNRLIYGGKIISPPPHSHRPHYAPQKHDFFYCFRYSCLLETE
jgi:hypothetical protein